MKNFLKGNANKVIIIVIMAVLVLINLITDSSLEITFNSTETKQTQTFHKPALSLNKGKYVFDITAEGEGITDILFQSLEFGEIYRNSISGGETKSFDIELKKNINELKLVTDSENIKLKKVVISQKSPIYTDTIFISLSICCLITVFFLLNKYSDVSQTKAFAVIILVALVSSSLLFTSNVFCGHDINFHLVRIEGIKDGLLSGQFPVRIHPTHNNGYGYITSSVYPELFLYFPALLRLLGVSIPTAYKAMILGINIFTAFIMYFSAKSITKSHFASCTASVIYTLSTWRLMNLFLRGALGEVLSMTFLPLVICGLYHVLRGDKKKWYLLVIGYTCIFQSHIISTVLCAILSIIMVLIFVRDFMEEKRWLSFVKALVFAVLINLWYLVPFIRYYFSLDMLIRQPLMEKTTFFSNSVAVDELFNIFGKNSGWALSLGFSVSVCVILTALYFIFDGGKEKELQDNRFVKMCFLISGGLIFAATTLFPWEILQEISLVNRLGRIIQFPWRFFSLVTPLIIICVAVIAEKYVNLNHRKNVLLGVCILCAIFALNFVSEFTQNAEIKPIKGQSAIEVNSIGVECEYLIKGTDIHSLTANKYVESGTNVNSYDKEGTNVTFKVKNSRKNSYVEVPLLYYPGYIAETEDGKKLETSCGDNNVLRVNLNGEHGQIKVKYSGFWYFRVAELISLASIILFVLYLKPKRKREKLKA